MAPGTPDQNQPQNPLEQVAEHIPSREEILEQLSAFCENSVPSRVLEDENKQIYLLEVVVPGEKAGESTLYIYSRKGEFPNNNTSTTTTIHFIPFKDGMPLGGGHNLADYNPATKRWERVG